MKRSQITAPILVIALSAFTASQGTAPSRGARVEREVLEMGTRLRFSIDNSDRQDGIQVIERAISEVERIDRMISTWRDDSELAAINRTPVGQQRNLSRELAAVLVDVQRWVQATGGAVDPAVGPLVDAWDLRGRGRVPRKPELEAALRYTGFQNFAIDGKTGTITRLRAGAWIDAGAFGKGLALRSVGRMLEGAGVQTARVDFGGQLLLTGHPPEGEEWDVELADPRDRSHTGLRVKVPAGYSVATSSQSERFVVAGGTGIGHILDPRSGMPVEPWGSVTVIERDPMVADLLSTALFVMRADSARSWAEQHPGVGVVLLNIRGDSLTYYSNHFPVTEPERRP